MHKEKINCFLIEESSHPPSHSLSIVKRVEFVDELVDRVTPFRNRAQVCDESNVVALYGVIRLKLWIVHEGETMNEAFDVAKNFVVTFQCSYVDEQ